MKKLVLLFAIACGVAGTAFAQKGEWPSKPIKMLVPYGAGGAADVAARLFAEHLGTIFGQQFVVENRTGGGGLIGAAALARSDPDGYTVGSGGMSVHVLAAALSDNPGFDPVKDFTHIAFLGGAPSVIVAHPSIGVKSMQDMLAYARGLPKEMPYVSSGTGTVGHIVFEYVVVKEKLNAVHVPYRAGSAAVVDLLAGRVTVGALNWATARQHIQAGTLIPLGVSSAQAAAATAGPADAERARLSRHRDDDLDHDQRAGGDAEDRSSMQSTARSAPSR